MVWLRINRFFQWMTLLGCLGSQHMFAHSAEVVRDVCVVISAQGEAEYGEAFRDWGRRWEEALHIESSSQSTRFMLIDGSSKRDSETTANTEDRDQLLKWIGQPPVSEGLQTASERWLVLIGHGTYEPSKESSGAKFNLRGGDLSPEMLSNALKDKSSETQPPTCWIIVNCSSCSGPFLTALSAPNRILITATKSGSEQNFSRFGDYFSQAISDPKADLDHDKSISILEAFLIAGNKTEMFYKDDGRLASEQSLLDDNGDKRGTPASFFQGTRPLKVPALNLQPDGLQAKRIILATLTDADVLIESQRIEVDLIENKIETLRSRKTELASEEYYKELQALIREIAKIRFP